MLDLQGSVPETSRRSTHQVVFEDEDNGMTELTSAMVSVISSDCEAIIDSNVFAVLNARPCVEQHSSPSSYVAFCNDVRMRGEAPKLSLSVGSCNVSSEPFLVLVIDEPLFAKWKEV